MEIKQQLAEEFGIDGKHCSNIVDLLEEGDTVPFIARYRKEMHGATDDQTIRAISERYEYLKGLLKRKEEIRAAIEAQGKWTDELSAALDGAKTLTEAEDIYRPYKQKKKTRASVAISRGLEPLADIIEAQELTSYDEAELTAPYIDAEKEVPDAAAAIDGACDIIAERISDDAAIRKTLRELTLSEGRLTASEVADADAEKKKIFETYFAFDEAVSTVPSHRVLAVNRGEKEGCLKVSVALDEQKAIDKITAAKKKSSAFDALIDRTIADSYDRLIQPSIEREVRAELFDRASEQAIQTFERNLKPLLLQPPLKGKVILGLDPAYRTGCKIAVIDASGKFLASSVVYPTPPQKKIEEAKAKLKELIEKYGVDCIAIGNGTASKESEIFVADLIKELNRPVTYAVVSEAGASVYSAEKIAVEEFPDLDLTIRSAISIARRLLDPLAELIKVDVRSLGVGQYQHDMPQKRLVSSLTAAVEDCVNSVGVDLNTASYSLLAYVSGLNAGTAKNIVEYRSEKKKFRSRKELLNVPKLGAKAFEQCAGFLRIQDGDNILDNTAVHPESYEAAQKLLDRFGYTADDVKNFKLDGLPEKIKQEGEEKIAEEIGVGVPTLNDIAAELTKPGRDVRDELPPPVLRSDLMDMNDLKEGMKIAGVVRNVTDFGAFVDISVHQDGLLHISEISDNFVRHPSDILKVGDRIDVWVLSVDRDKKRIALTMIDPADREKRKADREKQKQEREEKKAEWEKRKKEREEKKAEWEKRKKEREERGERQHNERPDRRFDRPERNDRGERDRRGAFEKRERSDYRERAPREDYDGNMSVEEKLAALAKRFNGK